jgi:hypothetical protein
MRKRFTNIVRESDHRALAGLVSYDSCPLSLILAAFIVSVFLVAWDKQQGV